MKRLLILAISALVLSSVVSARQLTPAESLTRFSEGKLLHSGRHLTHRIQAGDLALAYTSQHAFGNSFYAYNRNNSNGFVILSADDNMPTVLGYSDQGSFDFNKLPSNMKWLLSTYDAMAKQCVTKSAKVATRSSDEDWEAIEPLLGNITWDQSEPFNNNCPVYEGEKALTCLRGNSYGTGDEVL